MLLHLVVWVFLQVNLLLTYFNIFQKLTLLKFAFINIYPKDSGGIGQNRHRLLRCPQSGMECVMLQNVRISQWGLLHTIHYICDVVMFI